jgi:hypothetical protein
MPTTRLTPELISAAIEGFEAQKSRIDGQIAELKAMLPGGAAHTAEAPKAATHTRKKFSAATRQRMKEAQQLRWAKTKGEATPVAPPAKKAKRKLSAAGRAAIVAATKRRWAAKRAEEKTK